MKEHSAAIHVQVPIDVATFLLNEKRTDIHHIESRLKVSVTLIPNMHLETPHYNIARLRQDDMTSENLQASYKLVEKPEESKAATDAAQDAKAQRPQAVVQGITPAQPAPMRAVETAAQPSFFSRLFGWLKPADAKQSTAKPAAARSPRPNQPRRDRDGNRPGGNKDGSRRERPEGGNKPRRDEAAPRTERPAQTAPRAQEPRGERPPRPPRPPRVENEKIPALENVPPTAAPTPEQAEGSGNREGGRKRGRRGGRREREHREQQAGQVTGEQLAIETTGEMETARREVAEQPVIQAVEQHHTEQQPPIAERQAEPVAQFVQATPAPVQAAEQHHTEQRQFPVAERQPEPVAQFAQAVPAPAHVSVPIISSGLVQIETDPIKRATVAVTAQPDETTSSASRRRSRPREVYNMESSEPLVQIETHSPN
jgi:ribonuclease E